IGCSNKNSAGPTEVPDAGADDAATADDTSAPPEPYKVQILQAAPIVSDGSKPNFQNATAPVQLAEGSFSSVKLVVDLTSPCFPFSKWKTSARPPGQNW